MKKFLNSFLGAENVNISTSDTSGIRSLFGRSNRISPATAQRLVNVFGCVNIKANALAVIPIKVYRRTETGKVEARKNPLYKILRYKPNPNLTAFEWKKMLSQDLDLRGNHYCQIIFNRDASVKALYPLKADLMKVTWGPNRTKIYTYDNKNVPDYQILHLMDVPDSEGLIGLTRVEIARETLEYADNTSKHGNRVFKNGVSISGIFTKETGTLTEPAFKRLKDDLEDKFEGVGNAGKTMLLEEGLKFTPVEMKNTDAQWIESKKLNREEIGVLFGVPVDMLNDSTNTAYGNLEEKSQRLYTGTLLPIIILCEERFRLNFLLTEKQEDETSIKFKYNALMRADTKTRGEFYKTMHGIAGYSSNEIRGFEDENGYEGGDEYFMQTSYNTVKNIIKKGQSNE